ncbi:receptor like protein 27-like [Gastrolobium bilobum]|uniref:receptor like protein 27-like n=1 Tax=Gastrolobium bilobum TaxID=150636 RepID=UPI002AAFA2D7|nr:receptor like protein 27-like [Gastrolobium bilobum]
MEWFSSLFPIVVCFQFLFFHFPSFSSFPSHSLCSPDQSSALLQFKNSLTVNSKIETWENGTDCCLWVGVTCDTISGHVIGLDLSYSGLQGIIHPNSSLFRLSHLQTLNLSFNDFFSQFPSQFGGFVSLMHLNLCGCLFKGEIPSQISHLSKLESLDLFGGFEGYHLLKWKETTWKRLVQNATRLRELVLDLTDMSLINPSSLSLLSNLSSSLVTLHLYQTGLRGKLTNDILCLPNLHELSMSYNDDLKGQLPKLSCSTSLSILDLSGCQFQGPIPPYFSNLTHLTYLSLSGNNLNSSIPSSLFTLPRLTHLDLSYNTNLSGRIPNVFPRENKFQELLLSGNNIGGELPSSLSNLQHLTFLDLSSNQFSGQIPYVFGGLTNFQELDLSYNNFGGQIPSSLFDLTQLFFLDCSHNKLEGPLPNKIIGLSNLTRLRLNNNLLNGTIPSWCLSLPSLVGLDLSNNQFSGHVSAISSHSLESLYLCRNKLQGNIPESISNLANLTALCLSSNRFSGPTNFHLFSKLQNLQSLLLSQNSELSLNFESNANYSFSLLQHLGLSSINLTEFPKLTGKFPSLRFLYLSNNKLSGRVPNWLHDMDSLGFLDLSQNLFTSSMDQISWNSNLEYLDLSFNLLTGDISSSFCNASDIGILNLSHNKLTGIIPQCLANLSSLQVLDLQMNKISGTLPWTFSTYRLKTLNLNGNQIEGILPKSLSNCTQLEVLNLGNNQIEDTFPHWLQTLPNLKLLILQANKLHGPIASLKIKHMFPSLIIFDISSNNFSGPIPKAYIKNFQAMKNVVQPQVHSSLQYVETDLRYFTYPGSDSIVYTDSMTETIKENSMTLVKIPTILINIDLSGNKFEGEIPNVIEELHGLKGLNLSHNRLNGSIPKSMGNLTNLESLDLSSNMLSRGIPAELVNLNFLEVLNLSQNHLVGEIPRGKQFDTFSNDSYEGNLALCGSPLSINCNKDTEQHSPPSGAFENEEKFGFGWKPVAIGYGCGFVFGVGLGCYLLLIGKPQWLVRIFGVQLNKRVKRRRRMRTLARMTQLVRMS